MPLLLNHENVLKSIIIIITFKDVQNDPTLFFYEDSIKFFLKMLFLSSPQLRNGYTAPRC